MQFPVSFTVSFHTYCYPGIISHYVIREAGFRLQGRSHENDDKFTVLKSLQYNSNTTHHLLQRETYVLTYGLDNFNTNTASHTLIVAYCTNFLSHFTTVFVSFMLLNRHYTMYTSLLSVECLIARSTAQYVKTQLLTFSLPENDNGPCFHVTLLIHFILQYVIPRIRDIPVHHHKHCLTAIFRQFGNGI